MKVTAQGHWLTKKVEAYSSDHSIFTPFYHHINKGPLTKDIKFAFKQKYTGCIKKQKTQFKETEKTSEPDPEMAGMLELSGCAFETLWLIY